MTKQSAAGSPAIHNIIFDFGGVLMDWNPRYFYTDYFKDAERMEFFLKNIATDEWNAEQDRGRSLSEGTKLQIGLHPDWEAELLAYYDNWATMLKCDIPENVAVLRKLENTPYEVFGLTNWSAETFTYALSNYDFFKIFKDKIVVSGTEKLIKPDPKIWQVLLERYQIKAEESLFIDDSRKNIEVAESLGFRCIHVTEDTNLEAEMRAKGIKF